MTISTGIAQSSERSPMERKVSCSSPTNAYLQVCGRDHLAAMLATKRSTGVAPEVDIRE